MTLFKHDLAACRKFVERGKIYSSHFEKTKMSNATMGSVATLSQFFSDRGLRFIPRVCGSPGISLINGVLVENDPKLSERQIGIFEFSGKQSKKQPAVLRIFGSDKLTAAQKWASELSQVLNLLVVVELASPSPRYCRNFDPAGEVNKTRWAWIGSMVDLSLLSLLFLLFVSLVIPMLNFSSPLLAFAVVIRVLVFIIFHV
ncbi:MAG: hypothetical protein G01um101419_443 [Parcubacteria group bacterium Gr01-1014_19]|nr:MAG: hypothetical protein G01um101419_443 [Parcubacteria group bacterium Gr01-1014_19]